MAKRAARGRADRRGRDARVRGGREWVGGLLEPPFFVTDRDEPYRPGLVVWMDARDGLVVGQDVVAPEQADGAVARTLLDAMERPLGGPPRRPDRIRVADAATAAELRAALGDAMPIRIAPTPELDELLRSMLESMPAGDEPESYLEAGRVSLAALAELFRAADALYRFAPWRVATDDRVLRLDIPELGVEGACVSIIGYLGESLGLLVFPSLAGYEAFGRAAERHAHGRDPMDLGTDWLALNFERGADLPAAMRREVSDHRWPVADASAYPRVQRIERDGALRPIVERDVKIASACASSLVVFFAKHRRLFESEAFEPVCESTFDERDLEVRFTLPYEAYGLFDVQDAPRSEASARPRVGRNDPCPCGSGRKYKKCHLALDRAESDPQGGRAREHDLDGKIVRELGEYAMRRFGSEWLRFANDFVDSSETPGLAVPWSVYQYEVQGQSVAGWYLEERGRRMSGAERGWLAAQRAAWLSVWEVVGVEPGETVTLRDLLSNQERCVREASASESVVLRDAMLARVVDQGGISLLCGMHPRLLPPLDAAEVVRRARGRLRRRRAVPVERLREEGFGRYLIGRWEETVFDLDRRAATPPDLRNTDGDPLLLTTDHFEIEPSARAALESRLAGLEGAGAGGPEQNFAVYDFMHPVRENTLVGRALVSDVELRLETNSRERADALRGRVEAACGGLLRHRAREHADPLSPALSVGAPGPPVEDLPPEAGQLLLDIKRRHYAGWPDEALPALGGLSPREAVRTSQGRNAVDVLLKDLENHEQRFEGPDAFDFGELRRELRLDR